MEVRDRSAQRNIIGKTIWMAVFTGLIIDISPLILVRSPKTKSQWLADVERKTTKTSGASKVHWKNVAATNPQNALRILAGGRAHCLKTNDITNQGADDCNQMHREGRPHIQLTAHHVSLSESPKDTKKPWIVEYMIVQTLRSPPFFLNLNPPCTNCTLSRLNRYQTPLPKWSPCANDFDMYLRRSGPESDGPNSTNTHGYNFLAFFTRHEKHIDDTSLLASYNAISLANKYEWQFPRGWS